MEVRNRDAVLISQMFEHLCCIWWMDVAYWQIEVRREKWHASTLAKRTITIPFYTLQVLGINVV